MVSQNIGNGIGLLYATDLAATKIISCTRNDAEGVRNMRTLGAGSAPISAERSAVATVTFTAVGGAGNITAITIAGVNQIPSNVAATVGDPTQTATDVAAAINGYTPGSGTDFVANSVGGVLYIYSTPSTGQATNGLVVTVSVSNVAITFTKTDFAGGSSESGNTDSSVGLRFWLDPQVSASRTSFASSEEITKYIVVRGLQTGIVTKSLVVNNSNLTGIDRSCAITQIFVDTQSSAATDELYFIETNDFVEGDVVRLTQYVAGRVVTVTDTTVSGVGNIYLTNQSPFNCEDNKSIELRLQFDSVLGLIWIENGRSTNQGYVSLTRVEARALATNGTIQVGQTYFITDVGDDGIVLTGITNSLYSFDGEYIAVLPDYQNTSGDFESTWNVALGTATIGKLYAYNGAMWESLTGSIGSAPNTDAVNWLLIAKTDPRYVREIDFVQYDINSNKVIRRTDKRSNLVVGSDAINSFKWGDDAFTGNTIIETSNNFLVNSLAGMTGMYINCGSISCDSAFINFSKCNFNGSTITFITATGYTLTGWNVTNKTPAIFDLTKIFPVNNFENTVTINDTYSDLMAIAPTVSAGTLTLDSSYNYIGTLIINQTGTTISKIITDTVALIPFKTYRIVSMVNTTTNITFTAVASAVAGNIIDATPATITLTSVNLSGDAAYSDFCEIALGVQFTIGDIVWGTVNYKIYA